jgi:hypothetical protein
MARQPFHGLVYDGTTYDCGDKLGFLAANIAYGLEREDLGSAFRLVLQKIVADRGGYVSWKANPGLSSIVEKLKQACRTIIQILWPRRNHRRNTIPVMRR